MKKTESIILENEIDLKTWLSLNKSYNSYNGVKFHLEQDKENPKIKHVIYTFNEDNKIIKETKGKSMKQSEFQQYVIEQFKEQKKFNEQQLKFNEQQMEFNKSFSNTFSESVLIQSLFPVTLITAWSKWADSIIIFFVLSETAESFHQITQPKAKTFELSAITISLSSSLYSTSFKATNFSPAFAFLITIFQSILSASKIWVGCP